jgi:hypothetical protein
MNTQTAKTKISRRSFVTSSVLASAALPLALKAGSPEETSSAQPQPPDKSRETMPVGRIGGEEISRLMMGGNLIGGYSHSRDLGYVSTLMRRYNTPAKIRETLELGEAQGINAINTHVMQDNSALFDHWKNGGKIKWFSQVSIDSDGGYSQIDKAVDQGATGIHINGGDAEELLKQNKFDKVGKTVELIKAKKRVAGVSAHDLRIIMKCEEAGLDVDFYQKTLHSHDYRSAPGAGETAALGAYDNSWCNDPQAVIEMMAKIAKPWIAFKILAAGALEPERAFPYAFNSGADFILVGMFDWQVAEDAALARRVIRVISKPGSKRSRPWYGRVAVSF